MPNDFERNKQWADCHRDQIESILRSVLGPRMFVHESSYERDVGLAIDYEVTLPNNTVACRVRRIESCGHLRQLTISTSPSPGGRSEATKVSGGHVDWYLYVWSDDGRIVDWMVVDMRRVLERGLLERAMRERNEVPARDGAFLYISRDDLAKADAIAGASWLPL